MEDGFKGILGSWTPEGMTFKVEPEVAQLYPTHSEVEAVLGAQQKGLHEDAKKIDAEIMKSVEERRSAAGDVISDPKTTNVTEGVKYDADKPRMELHSAVALSEIAKVFTYGAKKYSPWNWKKGMRHGRLFAAMQRHLWAWQMGEDLDPETGMPHLAHAGCCLEMLLDMSITRPDLDDRYTKEDA